MLWSLWVYRRLALQDKSPSQTNRPLGQIALQHICYFLRTGGEGDSSELKTNRPLLPFVKNSGCVGGRFVREGDLSERAICLGGRVVCIPSKGAGRGREQLNLPITPIPDESICTFFSFTFICSWLEFLKLTVFSQANIFLKWLLEGRNIVMVKTFNCSHCDKNFGLF